MLKLQEVMLKGARGSLPGDKLVIWLVWFPRDVSWSCSGLMLMYQLVH